MSIGDDKAMLRDALRALPGLQADMRRSRPKKGYVRRILQVMACDCDDEGSSESSAWIELDLTTGRKALRAVRALLDEELRALRARRPTVGRTPGSSPGQAPGLRTRGVGR